ncbi:MAG: hypothetical protein HN370_09415 [Phycisphaerales bacterium]|nr:hypothetical protein [Phycisphaerales bacterium]
MKRSIALLILCLFLAGGPFLFAAAEPLPTPAQISVPMLPSPVLLFLLALGGIAMPFIKPKR